MSILSATTLRERASGLDIPVETVRQGSAKAWLRANQTGTQAINDSFNISSITDAGVGRTTVNATTPMANANFSSVLSSSEVHTYQSTFPTVTVIADIGITNSANTSADSAIVNSAIFGDHA